jgi:hypothetical protein
MYKINVYADIKIWSYVDFGKVLKNGKIEISLEILSFMA